MFLKISVPAWILSVVTITGRERSRQVKLKK